LAGRYGLLGLVALGAVGLAVLILRIALVEVLPAPFAAASSVAPDHPVLTLAAAELSGEQAPSNVLLRHIPATARQAPLASEPFLASAAASVSRGDNARAVELLEEARHRDPRDPAVRLLLMQQYVAQRRIVEATDELVSLTRLMPDGYELIVAHLAQLAADPSTSEATKQALADKPSLDSVLQYLATNHADPELILSFAEKRRATDGPAPQWQATLVRNLVEGGEIRKAYGLWQSFYQVNASARSNMVYDPEFRTLPGQPPFNWWLASGEIGAAEGSRDGALEVDYFGRSSGTLAEQLLMLTPGTYTLTMQAEGAEREDTSRLGWTVTCASKEHEMLAELSLESISYTPRRFSKTFTVPDAGCSGQWLRLAGIADEFPVARDAKISGLAVTRSRSRP
jgi:hypothetical protein